MVGTRRKNLRVKKSEEIKVKETPEIVENNEPSTTPVRPKRSTAFSSRDSFTPVRTRRFKDSTSPVTEICEVGWASDSPISLSQAIRRSKRQDNSSRIDEAIRKLAEESAARPVSKNPSSTPPLLGLWNENQADRASRVLRARTPGSARSYKYRSKPTGIKAAINTKELLQNLTTALHEITAIEKKKKLESLAEKQGDSQSSKTCIKSDNPVEKEVCQITCLDESADLFGTLQSQGFKPEPHSEQVDEAAYDAEMKNLVSKKNHSCEELWTDEELFEDESFILKATQVDMFESPTFATPKAPKRKLIHSTPKSTKLSKLTEINAKEITTSETLLASNVLNRQTLPYGSYYAKNRFAHSVSKEMEKNVPKSSCIPDIKPIADSRLNNCSKRIPNINNTKRYNFRQQTSCSAFTLTSNTQQPKNMPLIKSISNDVSSRKLFNSNKTSATSFMTSTQKPKCIGVGNMLNMTSTLAKTKCEKMPTKQNAFVNTTNATTACMDTSITDELLLTLAEPDEEFNTQVENALLGSPVNDLHYDENRESEDKLLGIIPDKNVAKNSICASKEENNAKLFEDDTLDDALEESELLAFLEQAETQASQIQTKECQLEIEAKEKKVEKKLSLMQSKGKDERAVNRLSNTSKTCPLLFSRTEHSNKNNQLVHAPSATVKCPSYNAKPAETIGKKPVQAPVLKQTLTNSQQYSAEEIKNKKLEAIKRRQSRLKLPRK